MMEMFSYPLRFETLELPKIWGVERWLVSSFPSCPSVISNGPLKGRALNEILPGFPVLMKEISADQWLSVQVHPGEEACRVTGGTPKNEMWRVLSSGPLFAGVKSGVAKEEIKESIVRGDIEKNLVSFNAEAGDVFDIPAGLVHTLGPGIRVLENQQPSDTTFRLYDWDRTDDRGEKRELQIEKALEAVNPDITALRNADSDSAGCFRFSDSALDGGSAIETGRDYVVVYCADGETSIAGERLVPGDTVLLPPGYRADVNASKSQVFVLRVENAMKKDAENDNER